MDALFFVVEYVVDLVLLMGAVFLAVFAVGSSRGGTMPFPFTSITPNTAANLGYLLATMALLLHMLFGLLKAITGTL